MKKRNIILVSLISIIMLVSLADRLIINSKPRSMGGAVNGFSSYLGPLNGKEISISEAQFKLPFKVVLPSLLGEPTLVKLIEESNFLYVIYSDKKATQDMSLHNIIDSGVIVLMEYPNTSLEEGELRIEAVIKTIKEMIETGEVTKDTPIPERVTINGHHGMYSGNVEHVLYWFIGTTNFEIRTNPNIPFSDLIEIAKSVKE